MIKNIIWCTSLVIAGLLLPNIDSAFASSAVRGIFCRTAINLAESFEPVHPRLSNFVIPTYDKAFKELLNDADVRNSLFRGFVDGSIQSSEILGVSDKTFKDQEQVTLESVGAFLNRYKPLIDDHLAQNPKYKKMPGLSTNSFIHELATKYYKPLCSFFPVAEKETYRDFTCCLKDGSMVLVEMQVRTEPYWNSRALAYAARVYGSQLIKGQPWKMLKKVYAVNILGGYEPSIGEDVRYSWKKQAGLDSDKNPPVLKRYQLVNLHNPIDKIPDLEIIQVFPQLFSGDRAKLKSLGLEDDQISLTAEWLDLFKEAQMKDKTYVDQKIKDPGVKKAYSILEKKELADNYKEWREKFGPSYADNIVQEAAAAKEEGETEALEKVARNLLKDGMSMEAVARNTGLSAEQIKKLKQ